MSEKARITKVQIGSEFINGIMLPNGDFGITVSQVSALFGFPNKHASRDLKVLVGATSGFLQK